MPVVKDAEEVVFPLERPALHGILRVFDPSPVGVSKQSVLVVFVVCELLVQSVVDVS